MRLYIVLQGPPWATWLQSLSWLGAFDCCASCSIQIYLGAEKRARTERPRAAARTGTERARAEQKDRELKHSQLELRWKQVGAAKDLLDEMLTDTSARQAMRMLDWNDLEYEVAKGKTARIWESDYLKALRTKNLSFDDKETYIRNCFDSLFYFMPCFNTILEASS